MKNKKGQLATSMILFGIILAFAFIIVWGVVVYFSATITSSLDQDIEVGAVNLGDSTQQTLGRLNTALVNNADLWAIVIIFGMFIGIMLSGFLRREETQGYFIFIDIIILVIAFVIAVYFSNTYETILNSIPFSSTYTDNIGKGSALVLNLPLLVIITGAISMILSYSAIPKSREEEVGGF